MDNDGNIFNSDPKGTDNSPSVTRKSIPVPVILLSLICAFIGGPIGMQMGLDAGEHPPLGSLCLGIFIGGFCGAALGTLFYYLTEFPPKLSWSFIVIKRFKMTMIIALIILLAGGLAWAVLSNPTSRQHLLLQYGIGRRDFNGISLRGISLVGVDLTGIILNEVDLSNAILSGANLCDSSLVGAKLTNSVLFEVNLFGADLGAADLTGTDLRGANLRAADLGEAILLGADLRGADLEKANLYQARYHDSTEWPSGFQPERSGAVKKFGVSGYNTY